jgi:arylformamidase
MEFFDVSLAIHEGMVVYPGNPKPSIQRYAEIPSKSVNESIITMGSHTGTHVDSKLHIQRDAEGAEALPLSSFYGICKVLDLTHIESEIHRNDLEKYHLERRDIILIKTKNSKFGYKKFKKDFVHLKIDAAEYLVTVGVKTLGFDYLSVKKYGVDREVHETIINNMTLFEGLNLDKVPPGEYLFIGLPLRIACDGAPARVVLLKQ